MTDALYSLWRGSLPKELASSLDVEISQFESGNYQALLTHDLSQILLGHRVNELCREASSESGASWADNISRRLERLLSDGGNQAVSPHYRLSFKQQFFFLLSLASLNAFVQSNVTGPPIGFSSSKTLFLPNISSDPSAVSALRSNIIRSLTVDGVGAYRLAPSIELFALADLIVSSQTLSRRVETASWARLRVTFLHQRLLSEIGPSLQTLIYEALDVVDQLLSDHTKQNDARIQFLLERATIHTYHGFDKKARDDLKQATVLRGLDFALTGLLGKRTKYQERDVSQLVVLAHSKDPETTGKESLDEKDQFTTDSPKTVQQSEGLETKPVNLDLNDDTLLEAISFAENNFSAMEVQDQASLPQSLKSLDPANQPILHPLDSIILLSLASSITNTSPAHGLTREETLPYASRVLDGGSSNWQIYTQALLVRSRIEGYRPRTMERGLLQLQALVDQVIAETTSPDSEANGESATTFLPRAKPSESAPVTERLRYVFALSAPSRWELEAELAAKWVSMGGLRTALEIYERMEMWADAALCWAATEREDKAVKIVRRQLFHPANGDDTDVNIDTETWQGQERTPLPTDAPRLFCILGDINKDIYMYEKAWEVSNQKYARAQRSLGRHYWAQSEPAKAAESYEKSLKVNQLNQPTWFALGCARLELSQFPSAKEAFSRAVQLDDADAEAWSNLAAALLHMDSNTAQGVSRVAEGQQNEEDELTAAQPSRDPGQYKRDALQALKHASGLKYDSHRIWDNLLTVAASVVPPSYQDVVSAMSRIIDIRGPSVGEKCIDTHVLQLLVRHVVASDIENQGYNPEKPGLSRMVVQLVDKKVVPLITASNELWQIVARLALWRRKPGTALEAHEKAWRAITSQPGWENGEEKQWNAVVVATVDLADAYQSLGVMEVTEGLAAGSGQSVAKDWKFKARSALREIMGRGKDTWEDSEGWQRLKEKLDSLRV